jgi:hypothetical protein
MQKYYKIEHYRSKNEIFNVFIKWYTTKAGFLKFNIEIYAEHKHNENGFCSCIAKYNTSDNALLQWLKRNERFYLIETK